MQVAAHELGKAVGAALPLSLFRVADTGSEAHPSCGATWSSTGSEGACQVWSRQFCTQRALEERERGSIAGISGYYFASCVLSGRG